jgi:hypothetical protein
MKTNRTPPPDGPPLAAALRACAGGLYPAEAAAELLIAHASWLCRDDFRDGYMSIGISITDGITAMAASAWPGAIAALDTGGPPCSGGERRVSRLAVSLAHGIPSTFVTRPWQLRPTVLRMAGSGPANPGSRRS